MTTPQPEMPAPALPRTFIRDLAALSGQPVRLRGQILSRRDLGGLQFVTLRDGSGAVQCVGDGLGLDLPLPESSVEILGTVAPHPKRAGEVEVRMQAMHLLAAAAEPTPVELPKLSRVHPDTLLNHRAVTVRGLEARAVLRVQAELLAGFRAALGDMGFTEISTPKIVEAGAEGGANLFTVDYFGEPAYLAQSPQLYKQMMVGAFERVFEVAPVFRGEQHNTSRHLTEYLSLDAELGFIDSEEDVMDVETEVLRVMLARVAERCGPELALLGATLPEVPARIPRIPLLEARALVEREFGHPVGGKDLDPEGERLLGEYVRRELGSDFVFVTQFPQAARPFYTHPAGEVDGVPVTRGFDLLLRGLEITSGGQRIHDPQMLAQSIEAYGLNPDSLRGYSEVFRYGMPPHGGFAIGAERLTALLLGLGNVRMARAFPRDRTRLQP